MQFRDVNCTDYTGKYVADSVCLRQGLNKPYYARTCWGSCGVKRSCEELDWNGGWAATTLSSAGDVCGSGKEIDGATDYGTQTYTQAEATCESRGARMCTLAELQGNAVGAAGNGNLWWSTTKCPDELNGTGYWMSTLGEKADGIAKGCAFPTELGNTACCSEYNFSTSELRRNITKNITARAFIVARGYLGWCAGGCKTYDGDCRVFSTAGGKGQETGGCIDPGDQCMPGVGTKYGQPEGASVCVPAYNTNQVTFMPAHVTRSQPVTFVFTSRGHHDVPPNGVRARIIKGNNPGCMGVWETGNSEIAADSDGILPTQGGWSPRPPGYSLDNCTGNVVCHDELPGFYEPWVEWKVSWARGWTERRL